MEGDQIMDTTPTTTNQSGSTKKIAIIVTIFIAVVIIFQTGLWFLSNNPNAIPEMFRNAFGPAPTPIIEQESTVVNPTPAYIGTVSVVVPEFTVGGIITSIDDAMIVVNTFDGEINVNPRTIDSFYQSTPDNVVVKNYETLESLEPSVGDLVSRVQNNDTYAIVKYVPVVE